MAGRAHGRARSFSTSLPAVIAARTPAANRSPSPFSARACAFVEQVLAATVRQRGGRTLLASRLGQLAAHPLWGIPILAAVLYALYWFVGVFGAGMLVGLLEKHLFGEVINPWVTGVGAASYPSTARS